MTPKKALLEVQDKILTLLKEKLPTQLTYHSYEHTLDVLTAAERIGKGENASEDELLILSTAAVFHDVGYIFSRENHEQKSCNIARELLTSHGIDEKIINKVCDLILATKVPQQPKDKLEKIICDADLDYLGRDDYFPISQNVFNEFRYYGIVNDEKEWKDMQVRFLESHNYFTKTAKETRNQKKEEHLQMIKNGI